MKEEIISLETAKLAKEKGFNWEVPKYYRSDGKLIVSYEDVTYAECYYDADDFDEDWNKKGWLVSNNNGLVFGPELDNIKYFEPFSAPTQSLLQKWLRDEHKIHIDVCYNFNFEIKKNDYVYRVSMPNETSFDMGMRVLKKHLSDTPVGQEVSMYLTRGDTYEEALELGLQEALQLIK